MPEIEHGDYMRISFRSLEVLGIFCTSLFLFSWGLSEQEVVSFESRFYLFALEMWRHGLSWFPTTYGHPYPDYPVTSTVLIYVFAHIFGVLNKLVAVLPNAIAAAVTLTVTYCIGALQSKRWGLLGCFFLLLTICFLKSARTLSLDIYLTMVTTLCFYVLYANDHKNKLRVEPQQFIPDERHTKKQFWIYMFLLLGFLFRGPIGIVIPAGVVCSYYLLEKNFNELFKFGFLALLILLASTLGLLMIAQSIGGKSFVHNVMTMQIFGRMTQQSLPFYFYFTHAFLDYSLSFPISLCVLIIVFASLKLPHHPNELKFILYLSGWALIILLGMSIPGDKKIRYVMPMTPAIALIAAYPFAASVRNQWIQYLQKILLTFFLFLPLICVMICLLSYYYSINYSIHYHAIQNSGPLPIHYSWIFIFLLTFQVMNFLLVVKNAHSIFFDPIKWLFAYREILILSIATLSFILSYIGIFEPLRNHFDTAHSFVVRTEKLRLKTGANLFFYKIKPDGLAIKYLINMPFEEQPYFIDGEENLLNKDKSSFIITERRDYEKLPKEVKVKFDMISTDYLGHDEVVVLKRQ